ncbi:hypothetical protein ACLB2K_057469 [Fragaria x ananassa]
MGPDTPGSLIRTDPNSGAHIMKFSMGTPPFDIYAMADTGSHLLWTQCEPCKACYKSNFGIFDPSKSSTYRKINCRARDCRLVGHFKPQDYEPNYCREDGKRPCLYSYSYADTATTTGVLSKETVTLSTTSRVVTLQDIVFGCGYANNETVNSGNEMGVIGLGRGPLSFVSQIAPYVGGKKFSHCLVDEDYDKISKIFFGNGSEVLGEGVVSTLLVDTSPEEMSYFVTVTGISFGNEFVSYNSTETLLKKGNVVIDSGTPVTRLPQDFFDRIVIQLKKMVKLESFVKNYVTSSTSNLCFNTTTPPKLPTVSVHFDGGGKLQLAEKQLLYGEEEDVFCFGLAKHTIDGKDFSNVGPLLKTTKTQSGSGRTQHIYLDHAEVEADVAAAGVPKKRTFKKFSFRGVDLDALLDMSTDELVKLFPARARRRFQRGLKRKPMALIKKLRKAKREAPPGEKPEPVRTHLRNMIIVPEMIGSIIGVYNGKTFNQVEIKPEMISHYLAEFSISYKPVKHGRPGIGATHSSRFIPLK